MIDLRHLYCRLVVASLVVVGTPTALVALGFALGWCAHG